MGGGTRRAELTRERARALQKQPEEAQLAELKMNHAATEKLLREEIAKLVGEKAKCETERAGLQTHRTPAQTTVETQEDDHGADMAELEMNHVATEKQQIAELAGEEAKCETERAGLQTHRTPAQTTVETQEDDHEADLVELDELKEEVGRLFEFVEALRIENERLEQLEQRLSGAIELSMKANKSLQAQLNDAIEQKDTLGAEVSTLRETILRRNLRENTHQDYIEAKAWMQVRIQELEGEIIKINGGHESVDGELPI